MKTAAELKFGETAIINEIDENHPSSRRVLEFGFTPGQEIKLVNASLFNDPLAFAIRGTIIAIRKGEADCIKII